MALTMTRTHTRRRQSLKSNTVSPTSRDAEIRITQLGLLANLGMAIGKGIGGYIFHSQALLTDGFHSLTDLVADLITLATVSWALKPPATRSPSRHGKIESLGALVVSALLLIGGVGMGWNAINALYEAACFPAYRLETFPGHDLRQEMDMPDLNAAWVAAGSILVKEWLYRAST